MGSIRIRGAPSRESMSGGRHSDMFTSPRMRAVLKCSIAAPRNLMLSVHDESVYAFRALRAGAAGYIMKAEATERLLVAVRRILEGGIYLSEHMQKCVVGREGTERRLELARK